MRIAKTTQGVILAALCSMPALAIEGPAVIVGAEGKVFDGLYGGVDFSRQNVIAGSLVGGVDILQEDNKFIASAFGGYRKQFGSIVIGVEGGYGRFDGELLLSDPSQQLAIAYESNSQTHYGAILGYAFGTEQDTLAFGYVSEVSRKFDVAIVSAGQSFVQRDRQGILRFGAGLEKRISGPFHARLTAGASRADFNQVTNIDPGIEFEFGAAFIFQF